MRRLLPLLALLALPVHAETLFAPNTTGCQIIGPIMVPDAANTQIAMTPTAATILDHDDADLEIEVMGDAFTAVQTFTVAGTDQLIDVTTTGTCEGPTATQIGVDALASGQIMLHVPDAVTNVSGNRNLTFYITDGNTNITDWWFAVSQIADETDTLTAEVWAEATRTLTSAANITSTGGTTVPQTGDSFARLGAPAGADISTDIAGVQTDTTAILADTNELQGDWADAGRLDAILDARASQASVDGLNDPTASAIATAVHDHVVESAGSGFDMECSQAAILAYALGEWTRTGNTITYQDPGGNTTRVTVDVASDNLSRSNVTITCP